MLHDSTRAAGTGNFNIADAAQFLKLLDPAATKFEFRTFDDDKARNDKENLLRTFYGTLAKHAIRLQQLNDKGAGVFVTINETDGKGRNADHIVRIRAAFADLDGAPLEPVMRALLLPHIVVESSPGKFHVYWRAEGMAPEDFKPVQKAVAERFHSDPAVHDLPRVMRLPGFFHRKREPFLIRITYTNDSPPYPATNFERRDEPPHISGNKQPATVDDLILAVAALEALPPEMEWKERNYIGMAVWRATDGCDEGFDAWCDWLQRSGRFDGEAAKRQWEGYDEWPPRKIGLGTLIFLADHADPNWRVKLRAKWCTS
jgi:hypothetical protein